jgi:hypothetical protein
VRVACQERLRFVRLWIKKRAQIGSAARTACSSFPLGQKKLHSTNPSTTGTKQMFRVLGEKS